MIFFHFCDFDRPIQQQNFNYRWTESIIFAWINILNSSNSFKFLFSSWKPNFSQNILAELKFQSHWQSTMPFDILSLQLHWEIDFMAPMHAQLAKVRLKDKKLDFLFLRKNKRTLWKQFVDFVLKENYSVFDIFLSTFFDGTFSVSISLSCCRKCKVSWCSNFPVVKLFLSFFFVLLNFIFSTLFVSTNLHIFDKDSSEKLKWDTNN